MVWSRPSTKRGGQEVQWSKTIHKIIQEANRRAKNGCQAHQLLWIQQELAKICEVLIFQDILRSLAEEMMG